MMNINLPLSQRVGSELIRDYLTQKPETFSFYHRFPSNENIKLQSKEKLEKYEHRDLLAQKITTQMQGLKWSEKQKQHLSNLSQNNTLTLTTGHQLNLLGGPLYFVYKIVEVIKKADELNVSQSDFNYVPIFWMATEDHDFEEINHFHLSRKYQWETNQKGGVGSFSLENIEAVFDSFFQDLPEGKFAQELKEIIHKSYFQNSTLADATRVLVHELLGEYGILILDADDAELKSCMVPYFREELEQNTAYKNATDLGHYGNQAHIREINLFYLNHQKRERISLESGVYELVESGEQITPEEMINELEKHPERFSPNVILRPLYQEVILPNVAYVGGGGEIAYWLQLKRIFDAYGVVFPILVLRNSFLCGEKKWTRKAQQFELFPQKIFDSKEKIIEQWLKNQSELFESLENQKLNLIQQFEKLEELAQKTHPSFGQMLNAQRKKQLNGFDAMKKRLYKAERKHYHQQVGKIENVYSYFFPSGKWQERYLNFSAFYLIKGKAFIAQIYESTQSFSSQFNIVEVTD